MLKRLKKLWLLSKKNTEVLDDISLDEIKKLPDEDVEFMRYGTEAEYEEFKKEETGLKKAYDMLKNL